MALEIISSNSVSYFLFYINSPHTVKRFLHLLNLETALYTITAAAAAATTTTTTTNIYSKQIVHAHMCVLFLNV